MTPSVAAALRIAQAYARGGSIAPGLPVAPFQPIAAPHAVMPRIAAGHVPRILPMARGHFADGGSTLPPHVLHALAIVHDHARQHFADGGTTLGIGDAPHPQGVLLNGDFGQGSGGASAGSGTTLGIGDAPHPQGVLLNGDFGQGSGTTGGSTTGTQAGNMQLGGLQLGGGEGSTLASLTGDPSGGASASTIGGINASTMGGPIVTPGGTITPGGSTSGAPSGFATGWQPNTLTPINNNGPLGLRPRFAKGGSAMHPSVLRALALVNQPRGHFDDGGNAGGGGDGNGGDGSGNGGGDSSGSGDSSSSSDRSGGGFSSGASSGADSSSPSSGGGGFSSGASSGADSASSSSGGGLGMGGGGIGGAVSSGNSSSSAAGSSEASSSSSGGFSSGAASGQDSSAAGPASSATSEASGVMGGAPLGGAAVTSSAPASAPASTDAGFGNPSNPAAAQSSLSGFGAFGSQPDNVSAAMANAPNPFGAAPSAMKSYNADGTVNSSPASSPYGGMPSSMTGVTSNMAPSATDNIAGSMQSPAPGSFGSVGLQNATPTASNFTGFSAGDLSANPTNQGLATNPFGSLQQHAAADPGEDGTTGMGPADATAGGFSPYGGMPASMTGVTSETAMASPNVGTFGNIGTGPLSNPGIMAGLAASAPAGFNTGLSASGLSTDQGVGPTGAMAGFDNFGADGGVTQSSLGSVGYTGVQGDPVSDAISGQNLPSAGAFVGGFNNGQYGLGGYGTAAAPSAEAAAAPAETPASEQGFTPDPGVMKTFNDLQQNGLPMGAPGVAPGLGVAPVAAPAATPSVTPGPEVQAGAEGSIPGDTSAEDIAAHPFMTAPPRDAAPAAPLGGAPVGDTGVGATTDPSSVDGTHALTVHGFSPLGPDAPADASTPATGTVPAGSVNGFDFDGYTKAMQHVEDPAGDPNAVSPTGAFGLSQFTKATWSGIAKNYPGLGLPATAQQASPAQQALATNALTAENNAGLQKAGIEPSFASSYLAHNAGINDAVKAYTAPDNTPIGNVISASTIAVNPAVYSGVQTVGQLKSKLDSLMGNASAAAPATSYAAPAGPAPNTFGAQSFGFSDAQAGLANDPALSAPTPVSAPAPATVTTMQPSPYAASPAEIAALSGNVGASTYDSMDSLGNVTDGVETAPSSMGYDATPANALTVHAFGMQDPATPSSPANISYNVMSQPAETPIGQVVPANVQAQVSQQYPGMFNGVTTVGDLRANIANIAATAGPQVAVTSTAPAATSSISPSVSAALSGIGAYTGDGTNADLGGAPQSFGMGIMAGMAPTTTNNLGGLGMVGYDGTSQVAQNMAGYSEDQSVSSLPAMARMAVTAPGFEASKGFASTPESGQATSTAATPGQPATTSDATTDTSTPNKNLAVNNKVANTVVNGVLGSLGPIGFGAALANMGSGLLGGPTIADGINNVLSHPGAPTSVTGRGDNAPGGGSASQSYYQNMMSTSPAASSSSSSSSAAPAPVSNDPYSDAMAAYLATMAADGTQSSSGTTSSSTLGVTNALQNNRISRAPLQPIYRPLEDPTVLRALGMT